MKQATLRLSTLAALTMLALAGCGGSSSSNDDPNDSGPNDSGSNDSGSNTDNVSATAQAGCATFFNDVTNITVPDGSGCDDHQGTEWSCTNGRVSNGTISAEKLQLGSYVYTCESKFDENLIGTWKRKHCGGITTASGQRFDYGSLLYTFNGDFSFTIQRLSYSDANCTTNETNHGISDSGSFAIGAEAALADNTTVRELDINFSTDGKIYLNYAIIDGVLYWGDIDSCPDGEQECLTPDARPTELSQFGLIQQ